MQKVKNFFENHKTVRVVCIVLAVVMAIGALAALTSVFQRDSGGSVGGGGSIKNPTNNNTGNVGIEGYGTRSSDYAALYYQTGLEACYVAYGTDGITDGGDGTLVWENQVEGGKAATLNGFSYWKRMNGGIGYSMNFEQWLLDRENVGITIPYDLYLRDDNECAVIESVFSYGYVTDKDGLICFVDSEHSNYVDVLSGFSNFSKSAFRFGIAHANVNVGNTTTSPNGVGDAKWWVSNKSYHDILNGSTDFYLMSDDVRFGNANLDKINLLSVNMKYPTLVFESPNIPDPNFRVVGFETNLSQGRYDDRESFYYSLKEAEYLALLDTSYTDKADKFSLLNGTPGTMYSVRYYNCEISDEIRDRNFFVDLCGFYGINVSPFFSLSAEELDSVLQECGKQAKEAGLEMDCANIKANRAIVYEIINANVK